MCVGVCVCVALHCRPSPCFCLPGGQATNALILHVLAYPGQVINGRQITSLSHYVNKLQSRGACSPAIVAHLHTLRELGNNARHVNTPDFRAADKPRVAHAVYAVATFVADRALAGHGWR